MVLVIRKKLIYIALALIFAVSGINIAVRDANVATSALPVSGKVVVLDAGHGGEDGGAVGGNGTVEKDVNLSVMLKLQQLLEQSGCTVITTRTEDISLHNSGDEKVGNRKISDLDNRKKIPEEYGADVFVSVHMNTFPDSKYSGAQVFYAEKEGSKELAENIRTELKNHVNGENKRETKDAEGNIYILDGAKVPSVVVECGFLSNSEEEAKLKSEEYQQKLAFAMYCGIIKFFAK